MYWVCGAWQLFVLTSGLTHFSQLHPGSRVALPIVTSPSFASSIFPFSNVLVSSGSNQCDDVGLASKSDVSPNTPRADEASI